MTGLSLQQADLAGKRIDLLREVAPGLRRLAVLGNAGNAVEIRDAQIAAGKLNLEVVISEIRRAAEIAPAFEAIQGRADALYVCGDALMSTQPEFASTPWRWDCACRQFFLIGSMPKRQV